MENFYINLIFWFALFLLFYAYVGYGIVLYIMVSIKKIIKKKPETLNNSDFLPEVTLIVPAYNEIDCIGRKVKNCLDLDYAAGKLKFMFITEGSTDGTTEYLAKFPDITLISGPNRRGKIQAINAAIKKVTSPIVVFTDANAILNNDAIRQIVKHYENPEVGAVAGEKRIFNGDYEQASGAGEGLYWKYESFLKKLDSELHTTVGAAGELFSIRTELYQRVRKDTLLDDFIISLKIAAKGYKVVYEPKAFAMEEASFSIEEEMKRKVRISTGGFQSVVRLLYLLNPIRYGLLTFQYVSHRVLRWTVAPFCLPLAFLSNAVLIEQAFLYELLFILQFSFYTLAFLGYLLEKKKINVKAFFVPFYFLFINYSVYVGLFRFITNNYSVKWEKARRAEAMASI